MVAIVQRRDYISNLYNQASFTTLTMHMKIFHDVTRDTKEIFLATRLIFMSFGRFFGHKFAISTEM